MLTIEISECSHVSASDEARIRRAAEAILRDAGIADAQVSIAIVDDVLTSGATLDEAARVLKGAGAQRVVNLVVARTD